MDNRAFCNPTYRKNCIQSTGWRISHAPHMLCHDFLWHHYYSCVIVSNNDTVHGVWAGYRHAMAVIFYRRLFSCHRYTVLMLISYLPLVTYALRTPPTAEVLPLPYPWVSKHQRCSLHPRLSPLCGFVALFAHYGRGGTLPHSARRYRRFSEVTIISHSVWCRFLMLNA